MVGKSALRELAPGRIWIREYPVRYAGTRFLSRMTLIRLEGGRVWIHSPCEIDRPLRDEIAALGPVAFIVAPGSFHYFHVESCQRAFPDAQTWICPGIERKRPRLRFDWILGDRPDPAWQGEIDQVLVRGSRFIQEVVFFDRPSRTLLVVDLIENIGEATPGTDRVLRAWWHLLRMWNRARPAPEYRFGWRDRAAAAASLERVLEWDFERVVLAHGDLITEDAKRVARQAWRPPLS